MNLRKILIPIIGAMAVTFVAGPAYAADLSKARGTVDNIRKAEPPRSSTTKKKDPSGTPTSEYRPKPPSAKIKEVPPPARNLNPTGDSDVQKGIDCYKSGGCRG